VNGPYQIDIVFNNKRFTINILLDRIVDGEIQRDLEIFTEERISGQEFQKIKQYLEREGYFDEAFTFYGITK
jgi:hypothetical protein